MKLLFCFLALNAVMTNVALAEDRILVLEVGQVYLDGRTSVYCGKLQESGQCQTRQKPCQGHSSEEEIGYVIDLCQGMRTTLGSLQIACE